MDISFIINELGEEREKYYGAVSPPIFQTSNFCFPSVGAMRESLKHEMDIPFYTRGHNPTVAILRKKIAALECAEEALIFGSGSAAISAAVLSQVKNGDHIVCVRKPYSWTMKLLTLFLERFGVTHTMIDGTEIKNWENAIQPNTKLFFTESPNSITFEMQDLEAVATLAKKHGIITICDNSYASPLNQQPITMGIDIVVHSSTKYIGGHSDAVSGVLATSREIAEKIFQGEYMTHGGIISPNDAWLLIRSLRTLPIRMERVAATGMKITSWLEKHPKVEKVIYPMSPNHPQYELAKKQMKRGTGQFTVTFKTDSIEKIDAFCDRLKRFLLACSWGGHESLIFPTSVLYSSQNYGFTELPWNLIRFYTGLEDSDILIADLKQAMEVL